MVLVLVDWSNLPYVLEKFVQVWLFSVKLNMLEFVDRQVHQVCQLHLPEDKFHSINVLSLFSRMMF